MKLTSAQRKALEAVANGDVAVLSENGKNIYHGANGNTSIPVAEIHRAGGLDQWLARNRNGVPAKKTEKPAPVLNDAPKHEYGGIVFRSGLEVRYAKHLDILKAAEEISLWMYEPLRIVIGTINGKKMYYTLDFMVFRPGGGFTVDETKGFPRPADINRLKQAAARFPMWRFRLVAEEGAGNFVIKDVR